MSRRASLSNMSARINDRSTSVDESADELWERSDFDPTPRFLE